MKRISSLLIICIVLSACNSIASGTKNYNVIDEYELSSELAETSGLYCPNDSFAYTINDSGNKSVIYQISAKGDIKGRIAVESRNKDWEAITGDNAHFYIGDIGNNSGKRKSVQIKIVAKRQNDDLVTVLKVYYNDNAVKDNVTLSHDFDAESLIATDDTLLLFSKSWKTQVLRVYSIDKKKSKQTVEPISIIDGLPGIVTGGDYNPITKQFILIGYTVKSLGRLQPFISILNKDLTLKTSFLLNGYNQVEGLCVAPNGEIWFTQESSFFSTQKLVRLKLN